jgi:hypothetical protein
VTVAHKVKIASAGNTIVPAYLALLEKGYRVSRVGVDEHGETWQALKESEEFIAEDPLTLLGLVALYEARGAAWQAPDVDIDAFLKRFP